MPTTLTPTRLPGLRAALARLVEQLFDRLPRLQPGAATLAGIAIAAIAAFVLVTAGPPPADLAWAGLPATPA